MTAVKLCSNGMAKKDDVKYCCGYSKGRGIQYKYNAQPPTGI
jgi:hypothetical protein